jgi:hypothetical protein
MPEADQHIVRQATKMPPCYHLSPLLPSVGTVTLKVGTVTLKARTERRTKHMFIRHIVLGYL